MSPSSQSERIEAKKESTRAVGTTRRYAALTVRSSSAAYSSASAYGAPPRWCGQRELRAVFFRFDLVAAPPPELRTAAGQSTSGELPCRRPPCISSGQGRAPRDVGARHVIFRDGMVAGARPDFVWGKRRQVSPCDLQRKGDIKQRQPEVRGTGSAAARSAQAAALSIAKVNGAELRRETGVDNKLSCVPQIDVRAATTSAADGC